MHCQMKLCAVPYSTQLTVLSCLVDHWDCKSNEYDLLLLQSQE